MFLQTITHFVAQKVLGKELALALTLLRMIANAIETKQVTDISRFVYKNLPANWRQPHGPATESEFVDMVQAGQLFLTKIQAVLKP